MTQALISLAHQTLRAPRVAAEYIMGQNVPRDALWTALALVAALNTLVVFAAVQTTSSTFPLPGYFERPLILFVMIAGMTVVFIHVLYWAGLVLGGTGKLNDMLALIVWFQVLRAAAQVAVVVTSLALPPVGLLLSLVVAVWGFWIFLSFTAAALHFASLARAFVVLVLAAIGLVVGLGLMLTLIGLVAQGVT